MAVVRNHVARHAASIGRSLAGGFKTTPLAAYPPALCMALAGAVVDAFAPGRRRGHDQPFASIERPWKPTRRTVNDKVGLTSS